MSTNKQNPEESNPPDERRVTDPVTHLPITIRNVTDVELERIPPAPPFEKSSAGPKPREGRRKDSNALSVEIEQVVRDALSKTWWEDPIGDARRAKVQVALVAAIATCFGSLGSLVIWQIYSKIFGGFGWMAVLFAPLACCILGIGVGAAALSVGIFQHDPDEVPVPPPLEETKADDKATNSPPESAQWLNSILHSLWPIVNPSLFIAVSDLIEDTMQATLPKAIYGVRVVDLGQGSEPIRVLGIRWLDPGSAAENVEGMTAEEGDFINLETAVAYRGKDTTGQGLRQRSANPHLFMEFYVAGGLTIPVWVEITAILATARIRLQLTPNPPFFSVATVTLLGLPKVLLKCTPLAKNFFNVMDIPGMSAWVKDSINLAVQEYVAPRSLTLDLKTLLMGQPKRDTEGLGVLVITIRRAYDLDDAFSLVPGSGKHDAYVTASWSKWGKLVWSTRVISSNEPIWEETTPIVVRPSEVDSRESLKLELQDYDHLTADDSLGSIVIPLKELMTSKSTLNKLATRNDHFRTRDGKEKRASLSWEVGYFAKITLEQHLQHREENADEIKQQIEEEATKKLREAVRSGDKQSEIEQQKKEDLKEKSDDIITGSRPTWEWPSGILSIRVQQITNLAIPNVRESGFKDDGGDEDGTGDLPSAYFTIILDHRQIYKSRTKMKSNSPYFDAGTETAIRNWCTTDVMIVVKDSRFHEMNPIVGVVSLPLHQIFQHTSRFEGSVPLVGGIGQGKVRLSLLFRSVQVRFPKRLLGWDIGTLEISHCINSANLPPELYGCRLVLRTTYGKQKMFSGEEGVWESRHKTPAHMPVQKRYSSSLTIEFRTRTPGPDRTPAFATLWLKDIPDNQYLTIEVPVRRNDSDHAFKESEKNASLDIGETIGSLAFTLRFWPGLSGFHKGMAQDDPKMAGVMEALDAIESVHQTDNREFADEAQEEYDDYSSSDEVMSLGKDHLATRSSQGLFSDFRKHQGDLHSKHRGLMQWKAVRNVVWLGKGVESKAGKVKNKVRSLSNPKPKDVPLEKEVGN